VIRIVLKNPDYPQYWTNFVAACGKKDHLSADRLSVGLHTDAKEAVLEYGGRLVVEPVRRRYRRNKRWVYYDDPSAVLVFEDDTDAVMFKMRWS